MHPAARRTSSIPSRRARIAVDACRPSSILIPTGWLAEFDPATVWGGPACARRAVPRHVLPAARGPAAFLVLVAGATWKTVAIATVGTTLAVHHRRAAFAARHTAMLSLSAVRATGACARRAPVPLRDPLPPDPAAVDPGNRVGAAVRARGRPGRHGGRHRDRTHLRRHGGQGLHRDPRVQRAAGHARPASQRSVAARPFSTARSRYACPSSCRTPSTAGSARSAPRWSWASSARGAWASRWNWR